MKNIINNLKEIVKSFEGVNFKGEDFHAVNSERNTITIGINLRVEEYGNVRIELDLDDDFESNLINKLHEEKHTIEEE